MSIVVVPLCRFSCFFSCRYDNDESEKVALLRRKPKFPMNPSAFSQDFDTVELQKGCGALYPFYEREEKEGKSNVVAEESVRK